MKLKMGMALILVVLILIPAAVSCSDNNASENGSLTDIVTDIIAQPGETNPEKLESGLTGSPDYEGYEFIVYIHGAHGINDFAGDEIDGEVINDAQYKRTTTVEKMYGVEIYYNLSSEADNRRGHIIIRNTVAAGTNDYDMAIMSGYSCCSGLTAGCLMDLNAIENLDLAKPWWDQYANQDFSFGDKLFMTTEISAQSTTQRPSVYT